MTFPCDEETAIFAVWYYTAIIVVASLGSAAVGILSWPGFVFIIALLGIIFVVAAIMEQVARWQIKREIRRAKPPTDLEIAARRHSEIINELEERGMFYP